MIVLSGSLLGTSLLAGAPDFEREVAPIDWWSLAPLRTPEVPVATPAGRMPSAGKDPGVESGTGMANPVDAFVLRELRQKNLAPGPQASPRVLVRRLTFDLTGLPPAAEEVEAFLAESSADPEAAWLKLVDRLLASPSFGEKWARHWLDVARYGETHGYDKDKPRENAWPYRDYVIRSFNEDKPYPRFVREQVAGDVLFPDSRDGVLGLGFLAAGPWDFIGHWEVGEKKLDGRIAKHLDRDEMISAVFNVFQSTTVQCAQCHHHKFDPIRMEDYYRLHAVFAAVDRADRAYAGLSGEQLREKNRLLGRADDLREEQEKRAAIEAEVRPPEIEARLAEIKKELAGLNSRLKEFPEGRLVYAAATHFTGGGRFVATEGKPRLIHLLHRGDLRSPGDRMLPGAPPLWRSAPERFVSRKHWDEGKARAELARYLTAPDNPLLWRSMANRLWQWTFGRPLAGTPNDFGRMGMKPTHPELLDYLAARLRDDPKHSLKSVIRLLVTTRAYRRANLHDEANARIDGNNGFLWRANRRRLTAEEYRDALLAVSGLLRHEMGGASFRDFVIEKPQHSPHYQYHLYDPADPSTHRRSIYRFVVRSQPQPFLTTLDCPDPSLSTAVRDESTTSLQALAQWNNRLVEFASRKFGNRIERSAPSVSGQVTFACREALGRPPGASEQEALEEHLKIHGPASLARVLFNLNAFVYID